MPHLIRDVAEEVLKDFLLLKVIGPEAGEELIRVLRHPDMPEWVVTRAVLARFIRPLSF
jgi:hypothetical protein